MMVKRVQGLGYTLRLKGAPVSVLQGQSIRYVGYMGPSGSSFETDC